MSPLISALRLGQDLRVIGTIITEPFLLEWSSHSRKLPVDLVELRVDGFPEFLHWLDIGEQIEGYETPVLATIRLASEGGKWTGLDSDRWPLIEQALRRLSGVDVEIQSDLADLAAEMAKDLNKLCVLSYHNFELTPPVEDMRQMIQRAHERGCIGKVAATIHTPDDLANLRSLLSMPWDLPVCLIGMGTLGRESRLNFPREGSCFTYGYLDTAGAPGQYSASELMQHFGRVSTN